jgi:NAD(P)H-hydrate epimerase
MLLSDALYSADQVRELDRSAIEDHGLPGITLMKRAGRAAFEIVMEEWPDTTSFHILCGSGNNGGDGYVVAGLVAQKGLGATVWQLSANLSGDAKTAYEYAVQEGVVIKTFQSNEFNSAVEADALQGVIVDGLLGTGYSGELKSEYAEAINCINQSELPVLSLDIPSGVNCNTGAVSQVAVEASVTVSFIAQKLGNLIGKGRILSGERVIDDLDVPADVYVSLKQEPLAHTINLEAFLEKLPERSLDAHKGDSGHVLVVGGDHGYGGAPLMAAEMAARTGAGLVGVVSQPENISAIIARRPEIMAAGVTSGQEFLPFLERPSVLVTGPGLGRSGWSEQLLYHCLHSDKSMVLDADALNLLSEERIVLPLSGERISTPHPGEAARLLSASVDEIQSDRVAAVTALQEKLGGAVVLKGAGTLVMTSDQQLYICDAGNPGMASGGMGDVLSGLLGALLARGMSADDAACLGVILHSTAADIAVSESNMSGLLATDLVDYVRLLLSGEYSANGWVGFDE